MKIASLTIQYSGFVVVLVGQDNSAYRRIWTPGQGEYEKNLFCTYVYRGSFEEFRTDNDQSIRKWDGEFFSNTNLVLDFPTYEMIPTDSTWLCFSSYKPLEGEFVRLNGTLTVPAGTGVYCVLGSFTTNKITAIALNYVKPRDHDMAITGNAKIVLIKSGTFVNIPP